MDGHLGTLNYYLLGSNGLYSRRADGKIEKLVDLYKAHSIAVINNTEIVIATDAGLFLFNATTQKLSDLIKGVEFNRWGLHLDQDKLYAGSINGLYILDTKNLGALSELVNTKNKQTEGLPSYMLAIMAALVTISILLAFLLIRSRRRLNRIIKEVAAAELPETTKEDIEQFIRENLAIASLKSIADHFKTKTSTIYTILDPEKPGAFIQQLRLEKVMEMRKDKTSAKEIAAITGFSESYVRKIWNQKD
jgi:AraC-like DNA-binding protein